MSYRMYEFFNDGGLCYKVGIKHESSTECKINLECIPMDTALHDDFRLFDIDLPKKAIENLIGLLEELL